MSYYDSHSSGTSHRRTIRHNNNDGARTGFLWNPDDSVNYTSILTRRSAEHPSHLDRPHGDFSALITTISSIYQHDRYLAMRPLDNVAWTDIGAGSTFQVSRAAIELETIAPSKGQPPDKVINKVVIKRTRGWSLQEREILAFNREVRILNHLYHSDHIVKLVGIGWFYNHDPARPLPQPVLMLEEASFTLRHLTEPDRRLPAHTILKIFDGIARGLSALHSSGIIHGDLAIDNILLFPSQVYVEGVKIGTFTAKLSDFGYAMFDTGKPQRRLGGTTMYLAPESGDLLDFAGLKKTDVYSFGVLYTVVSARTEDILDIESVSARIDSATSLEEFMRDMIRSSRLSTESSLLSSSMVRLIRAIFCYSLRYNPNDRNLGLLLYEFDMFYRRSPYAPTFSLLNEVSSADLSISYGKLLEVSGLVKDEITNSLHHIVDTGTSDPRYAKALFELATIWISGFNNPCDPLSEGFKYLEQAATHGELRAQAIFSRMCKAYGRKLEPLTAAQRLDWLRAAASAGFQIALEDLARLSPSEGRSAMRRYANTSIRNVFGLDVPTTTSDGNALDSLDAFQLHWAAATGSTEDLLSLLSRAADQVNILNNYKDTPLLSACRFGQFETALSLIMASADVTCSNLSGENCLHFLWRFELDDAKRLLVEMLRRGADYRREAAFSQRAEEWCLVPKLVGTPIERAAACGRTDIVKLMMENGCPVSPRNGNVLRRMLLLAIRMQHTELQELLISYALKPDGDFRTDLRPLHEAAWEYKGQRRTLLDASILGWVRQTGAGVDLPLDFWQACYHGEGRHWTLSGTVNNVLCLLAGPGDETKLDDTIRLAVKERTVVVLVYLLDLKTQSTDGASGRLTSLHHFRWQGKSLRAIVGEPTLYKRSYLPRSVLKIGYIDQIFNEPLTLAQQALRDGDRTLFYTLVDRYQADLSLPFNHEDRQMNCYAAVARTDHQDFWFM